MEITAEKAIAELRQTQQYKPVYLLTGEENYLIDQICDYMENNLVPADFRDFDQKVVYGRDVTMQEVVNLAKQYPMLSPVKLVVVKEAQDIPTKEGAWDCLSSYLEKPSPSSVLVLCYRHKSLDKRTAAYKAIAKHGSVYEHKALRDYEVAPWIAAYVRSKGGSITEKCATLISSTIGSDRSKLVQELDKVLLALPEGGVINDAAVEKYMGISKDYNVFELQNAIGRRDMDKCSRIVNHFAANPKENPIQMVIPVLYKYIINLMLHIQDSSQTKNPYAAREYDEAARNYTLPRLALAVRYLHEADLKSKGIGNAGTVSDGEILKELIFKITH
ncbi:MAG: DNA polymerase III subunit delta [Bacteroidales bacterium]|nr:DNA polymerase III subunit delta [Bacteroidales bacterium]